MSYKIVLSLRAKKDIEDSYDWYEEQLVGLGSRFIMSIGNDFNSISINPETFSKQKNDLRQKIVSEFPFLIVYNKRKRNY